MSANAVPSKLAPTLILGAALALILAAAALFAAAMWNIGAMSSFTARVVAIGFFLYLAPFEVLIHELGHLGAALAVGWRVPILALGGFSLRFSPLRFSSGAPAFAHASGAIVAVPGENNSSRWRWIAVHAGGPAANVFLAALAAMAGEAAPKASTASAIFLMAAAISLASGLYNLIPFRGPGGGGSDGLHIVADFFAGNFAGRGRFMRLLGQKIDGTRPREWDPQLVRAVEADSVWTRDSDGTLFSYAWHLDRGDIDQARAALRRAAAHDLAGEEVAVEEAFLAAQFDNQPLAARRALALAKSWRVRQLPAFWRAQTVTALAENDGAGAREALRKWVLACKDWAYTTDDEREWLGRTQERVPA